MKHKLHSGILLTIVLLGVCSCDNFLSENPDNRVDLDTPEKAAQLLTNAYTSGAYLFTEWMGDNVSYTLGTEKEPKHLQAFKWEESTTTIDQDTPTYFWLATYDAIAHANEVLKVLDGMTGDEARKAAIRGEALLTRAYGHFMLVNLFAKHYNAQTAASDPGIPYVEEPETVFIKQYARNTVADVYSKIERDLREGLLLVDGRYYANSGKYHFTKNAALAFASRYYLFKGDYENCINYSSELLGSSPGAYVKDLPAILATYANTDDFVRTLNSPSDNSNLMLIRNETTFMVPLAFWPSIDQIDFLYYVNPWGAEDLRRSNRYPLLAMGTNGVAAYKFEWLFQRTSLTSNVGFYYTIMSAFRGEEVLLSRAEAYALTGQSTAAIADMQVYVNKRYEGNPTVTLSSLQNHYQTSNSQAALLAFIVDERNKEFLHEGLRWFDIRRFGIPVTHILDDGAVVTLAGDDLRHELQIPQSAIDVGGLAPNPR